MAVLAQVDQGKLNLEQSIRIETSDFFQNSSTAQFEIRTRKAWN